MGLLSERSELVERWAVSRGLALYVSSTALVLLYFILIVKRVSWDSKCDTSLSRNTGSMSQGAVS